MGNEAESDQLRIFHVGDRRYGIFYRTEYLATMSYEEVKPMMLHIDAQREYLAKHGIQAGGSAKEAAQ